MPEDWWALMVLGEFAVDTYLVVDYGDWRGAGWLTLTPVRPSLEKT